MFGIDLDGCRDPQTKKVAEWAREIILYLNSYSEVSPSLTGVKIYCLGKLPFENGKKAPVKADKICDKEPAIEAYDHGRYFAVTGMTLYGMPTEPQERTEQVKYICDTYFKPRLLEAKPAAKTGASVSSGLTVIERARKYLDRLPPSVSGQDGHGACFHAACVLVLGFGLNESEALVLLSEFNHRCQPPWSERELEHKIQSANKQPGDRGYLRDARQDQWDTIAVPHNQESTKEPTFQIKTMKDASLEFLEQLAAGKMDCITTGLPMLDEALGGGVLFGEYVVIGARPSHGKTAFAMQLLDSCCALGYKSAFISEEMSRVSLGRRNIQMVTAIEEKHWKTEIDRIREAIDLHHRQQQDCIVIESVKTAVAASDCIRHLAKEHGIQCVAIDYAQLLEAKGKSDQERVAAASKLLKQVANDTGVILFTLAQLNREIEKRDKLAPKITDLGQSDQLARDADVVLFLTWPYRVDPSKPAKEFQIWCSKNRNRGVRRTLVDCEFTPSRLRIAEAIVPITERANYEPAFNDYNQERF
jgi:KaiC/GvpD/RAD55 family RecA-like ATPase